MEVLKHIIPLVCILTINNQETSFIKMFQIIEQDEYVYNILLEQIKSWWGNKINSKLIKKLIDIYKKYIMNNKEI